tara:strand:- start:387 stop:1442 length:1056 start_codon:yes stop_codon:yes gene_type:complete
LQSKFSRRNLIAIIGKSKGFGGVQTVHNEIFNYYKSQGADIYRVDDITSMLRFLFKFQINRKNSIAYFSGISVILSPLFLKCKKHIFFTHGFYVYDDYKKDFIRFIKKNIYKNIVKFSLFFYKWIYCIAPTPISALFNQNLFSRRMYVVPWGVSKTIINQKISIKKDFTYHLTFLGRPNSQKLNLKYFEIILKLFLNSKIVNRLSELNIVFVVPYVNKDLNIILEIIENKYKCSFKVLLNENESKKIKILSQSLYFFNCFEWEAFGLTYIEALCMGCNIIIPSTSPILPIIDNISNSPVNTFTPSNILKNKNFEIRKKLYSTRQNKKQIEYYRSIFNWGSTINEIHNIIKL